MVDLRSLTTIVVAVIMAERSPEVWTYGVVPTPIDKSLDMTMVPVEVAPRPRLTVNVMMFDSEALVLSRQVIWKLRWVPSEPGTVIHYISGISIYCLFGFETGLDAKLQNCCLEQNALINPLQKTLS